VIFLTNKTEKWSHFDALFVKKSDTFPMKNYPCECCAPTLHGIYWKKPSSEREEGHSPAATGEINVPEAMRHYGLPPQNAAAGTGKTTGI
jgi:hypothetical protein